MRELKKGDIVQHTILGSDKVVVGVGKDRYLCVHSEDIGPDGRVRANARVAMHCSVNLQKIGHRDNVIEVNLDHLYEKEMVSRHGMSWWRRERILFNGLFVLAAALVVLGILSGIELARREIGRYFFKRVEEVKTEYRRKIRKELRKEADKGGDAKTALKEIFQRR